MREPSLLIISNKLEATSLEGYLKVEFTKWSCDAFLGSNFKKKEVGLWETTFTMMKRRKD